MSHKNAKRLRKKIGFDRDVNYNHDRSKTPFDIFGVTTSLRLQSCLRERYQHIKRKVGVATFLTAAKRAQGAV